VNAAARSECGKVSGERLAAVAVRRTLDSCCNIPISLIDRPLIALFAFANGADGYLKTLVFGLVAEAHGV